MKILLKGFGSIGKRHASNLLALGYTDLVIITSKSTLGDGLDHLLKYRSVQEAADNHTGFTHGFICSPTAFHMSDLKAFLKVGIPNIYIEKPVSHTLDFCIDLGHEIQQSNTRVQVGFDLHFDPGLMKAKEIIESGEIGKILSANAFVGQYLPDWRPYEDHRKGMSASIEKGGGVMLDLVHEFDYLRWIMGLPAKICAIYQSNPLLEIETEDVSDILIQFSNGATASLHLDYHQRDLIRNCVFTGEKGTLIWDLAKKSISLTREDRSTSIFDFSEFERNDRYVQIVKSFIEKPNDLRLTSFNEALVSLRMVLDSKKSSDTSSVIEFKKI
ncbi:putative dehydrogenase [Algoriphagus aquaeductus]|uniref:Putative dehydrogenase n=1 Tax=Algoriphagus aquaeductus TaxID=475299 RepID=A0A326RPD7_9BACT|nr:Gfo/Idh/MocA family oxidoreductase [Algoriphagus aquaeductus]PZV79143.1 putative dehydrogenase [Algoriphagus aquaeductus]